MKLPENLNLELAWQRHKKDLVEMAFCDHPYEVEIIDHNIADWLTYLKEKCSNYCPSRAEIVNIPKKGFHLRPGSILTSEDATIYHALLLKDIEKIRKGLLWSAQKQRYSCILKEDQTKGKLFVHEYKGWSSFRDESLKFVEKGYEWVVFADISAYFENISIGRLISDLNVFGVTNDVRQALSCCLNRWSEPRARGIPQGNRCSSVLGEVYLNSIDRRLKNKGIKFCRYVDDIRIFCNSKTDAIASLHLLTILLREKELNLQTAKSFIKHGEEAKIEIDSISELIKQIEAELLTELSSILEFDMDYMTPSFMEQGFENLDEEEIELATIQQAFDNYIIPSKNNFDKTLFHYCIKRFGVANDDHAVDFCIKIVLERPEEFTQMLNYFSKLSGKKRFIAEKLIDVFEKEDNVLDRHYFLLLRWFFKEKIISEKILEICRKLDFDQSVDIYTKHYAWAILGDNGDQADLDEIEVEYSRVQSELSKTTIIAAIRKMVIDRRNTIYNRAKDDSRLIHYTVNKYKQS